MKTTKSLIKKLHAIYNHDHGLTEAEKDNQCKAVTKTPSVINIIERPYSRAIEITNANSPGLFGSEITPSEDELIGIMIDTPSMIYQITKPSQIVSDAAVLAFNGLPYDPNTKVTYEMFTTAISKCGLLLDFVEDRTEERSYLAICNTIHAFHWIDNPSKRIVDIASQTIWGLIYMFGSNRNWTPLTEELKTIAKARLNNYSIVCDHYRYDCFRKALFSLISENEILFYLETKGTIGLARCIDFIEEPSDKIKKALLWHTYKSTADYQNDSPASWTLCEETQLLIARIWIKYPEIYFLKNASLKAKVSGLEMIAWAPPSLSDKYDENVCIQALKKATTYRALVHTFKLIETPSESVKYVFEQLCKSMNPKSLKKNIRIKQDRRYWEGIRVFLLSDM